MTMKTGMTLSELANQINMDRKANQDLLVNTENVRLIGNQPTLFIQDNEFSQSATITDWTHQQIAEATGVPMAYYRRMMNNSAPLLNTNINHWWREHPSDRLIRIHKGKDGGRARAWLSPRYRRLDNWDLAQTILPVFNDHQMEIASCNVSESYMHIKALFHDMSADISQAQVGDTVRAGITIRNSEIGKSRLVVAPFMERLVCKNGMVFDDYATKQIHLGKRIESDDPITELYTDETLVADDRAFWLKVRDTVKAALRPERFVQLVEQVKSTRNVIIRAQHLDRVRDITRKVGFTKGGQESILERLINHEGLTQFGLAQAISAEANSTSDYDTASQFEVEAGRILTMTPSQFGQKLTEK